MKFPVDKERRVDGPQRRCGRFEAENNIFFYTLWPPKSGSYLLIVLIVLLMMGILVPETC
jgi:hypothetical protein